MATRKPRQETKRYKTVGNSEQKIDPKESRAAFLEICSCRHMTPATVAEMDERLGTGTMELGDKPEPALSSPVNEADSDWVEDVEPSDAALRAIDAE